jgi:hypothetical protein
MGAVGAISIGLAICLLLSGPTAVYWRREILGGWKEVFGMIPEGAAPRRFAPSPLTRFRRSRGLVALQAVLLIVSGVVAVGADDVAAAALSTIICMLASLSLGLHLLATSVQKAAAPETENL